MEDSLEDIGAELTMFGGNCPVQAEGKVDGNYFYFRARGDEWQFHVARTNEEIFSKPIFYKEQEFGTGFDASWMDAETALDFITESIAEYRAKAIEARQGGDECSVHESAVAESDLPKGE